MLSGMADRAAMPDCESMAGMAMDAEQPSLCKAHCDQGKQSLGGEATPVAPMLALIAHGLGWRLADDTGVRPSPASAPDNGLPRGRPPIYIAFLVLRN